MLLVGMFVWAITLIIIAYFQPPPDYIPRRALFIIYGEKDSLQLYKITGKDTTFIGTSPFKDSVRLDKLIDNVIK